MKKNFILLTLCIIISCGSGSSSDQVKSAISEKQSHANNVIANKKIPKTNVATKSVIEKNIANLAKSKKISSQKRKRKSVKDSKIILGTFGKLRPRRKKFSLRPKTIKGNQPKGS